MWYPREAEWIAARAAEAGVPRRNAIAAYASLSPQLQVVQNRRALVAMLEGRRPGVFGRSIEAAERCLRDHTLVRGLKVRPFDCNLAGCENCVTCDRWAARAVDLPEKWLGTAAGYNRVAAVYVAAARRLDCAPRTLQAAMWLDTRGVMPSDGWTDV